MAPQTSIPPAANILGTIGTICWCVQLLPQIWRNWRTKSTEGLPATMMFLWSASGVPFGIYAIVQNFNIPLQVQPQCFCFLCGVSWAQCLVYGRKWRAWTVTLLYSCILLVYAALQAGLVFAIRPAYARGTEWPVLFIGIIAFIVLLSGYFPIPFELIKRRGRVVGIDFIFLGIDWFGAFFSLVSLVAQEEFDALFGTLYALCCAIEMSMVASHLIWMMRTKKFRKLAKDAGVTFDEHPECVAWQAKGIDLGAKFRKMVGMKEKADKDADARPETSDEEEHVEAVQMNGAEDQKNTVPNVVAPRPEP
ncbi:PQ loop repeat protein [Lophiotrema nucula]|uniref:PQ loop repeat protein n=1 Tax=Lophiotrema nucula TaxID=690887 RepID=A0A6A5Z7C0_9PLEO|nr:PQ loop repeat protein [Lophiotrema nucula]